MRVIVSTAALLLVLSGCGSIAVPGGTVKQAVWTPCPTDVPERPVFPADGLTGDEDVWTLGTRLWADRKARQAYEIEIETRLRGCVAEPR